MNIAERILWLLGRAADQQSSHIALHLKLSVDEVEATLEQLAQAGQVECVAVKRSQGTVRLYKLLAIRSTVTVQPQLDSKTTRTCPLNSVSSTGNLLASTRVTGGL